MNRLREIAWASGLFEGEGHFGFAARRGPVATVTMTDEDPIRRFHAAVGFGKVYGPYVYQGHPKFKPYWRYQAHSLGQVQALGALLWDGLGRRRRDQLRAVIEEAAQAKLDAQQRTTQRAEKSLSYQLFGKRLRDLNAAERREYNTGRMKAYRAR